MDTSNPWQDSIRASLIRNQAAQDVYAEVFDQYRRLAKCARDLRIRNRALLKNGAGPSAGADGGPSPLLAHLDAQLSALRNELSSVYRTQAASQNKQLSLSDALRDRDEEVRGLREEVRELREAQEIGRRKEKDWEDRWRARTKDMEFLNDELLSLNLELTTVTQRNNALQADNASLLQRWIDKMNLTAEEMNEDLEKESKGPDKRLGKPDFQGEAIEVIDGWEVVHGDEEAMARGREMEGSSVLVGYPEADSGRDDRTSE